MNILILKAAPRYNFDYKINVFPKSKTFMDIVEWTVCDLSQN